jgi:hypothetical protein
METSKCRGCGADIIWTVTEQGNRMPVDARPEKRLLLMGRQRDDQAPIAMARDTYMSHFATCPNAAEFRRRDVARGSEGER